MSYGGGFDKRARSLPPVFPPGGNGQAGSYMPAYLNIWTRLRSRHVFTFHVSLPVGNILTFFAIAHSPDTIIPPQNKPPPLGHVGIVHNRGLLI